MRVSLAVALGLLVGKPVGIALFALAGARLGWARLPDGIGASALLGVGLLGGVGFTMALFISALAFGESPLASAAKVGVLAASVLSCVGGLAVLSRVLPRSAAQ
jgi:Na+:H+ antiporter, NhaA family